MLPSLSDATALLIFARPVAADATCKRLATHTWANRHVLARLNRHVTSVAMATGLPVLRSTDLIGHQEMFGDQLSLALQAAFSQGFARVLVVGNDCPALTTAGLLAAANALRSTPVVLGPDRRGGLYLLGLARRAFDPVRLAGLPWQQPALCRATSQAFSDYGITWLTRLGDVNRAVDLQTYQTADLTVGALVAALLALIGQLKVPTFGIDFQVLMLVNRPGSGSLRAPPTARPCALKVVT